MAPYPGPDFLRRMIKVTHILRSLEVGGAEKLVADLACLQKRSGEIDPSVICMIGLGPLENTIREAGIRCETAGLRGVKYLSGILSARSVLSRNRPDIVHTHNLVAHLHGGIAAKSLGIPVIHTKHGREVPSFRKIPSLAKTVYGISRRTAVVSRDTGEIFQRKTGVDAGKIVVVHNGIDFSAFGHVSREVARKSFGISPESTVFGSVSRLDPVKDHATMLRAFARVAGDDSKCLFLIVGDGPERGNIERMIEELSISGRVIITGFTDRVKEYLAAMDLFLQPSTEEGLSLTILEAVASGVPVITTPVGGTPEIITGGKTGTFVDVGDAEGMALEMESYIRDRSPFVRMAENARKAAMEEFSLSGMTSRYEQLYKDIVEGKV